MNCEPRFNSWENMYYQLLKDYANLASTYHQQTQNNFALYQQLQNLYQERINLLEEKPISTATIPSSQRILPITNDPQVIVERPRQRKPKNKGKKKIKRQRIRRNNRIRRCPYEGCKLTYHTSTSFHQHIQFKHNGGTIKQRQTYIKMLIESQQKGSKPQETSLNLPPHYVEQLKRKYSVNRKQ